MMKHLSLTVSVLFLFASCSPQLSAKDKVSDEFVKILKLLKENNKVELNKLFYDSPLKEDSIGFDNTLETSHELLTNSKLEPSSNDIYTNNEVQTADPKVLVQYKYNIYKTQKSDNDYLGDIVVSFDAENGNPINIYVTPKMVTH